MSDVAAKDTQKKLDNLETEIRRLYKRQKKELTKKQDEFMKGFAEKYNKKQAELSAGTLSQESWKQWVTAQIVQKKWYDEMISQMTEDMTLADVKAMSMVNGFLPEAYAINRNYGAFEVEKGALIDTSFTMYDAHTVEKLVKEKPRLLPKPSPDIPKELQWHKDKISSAITAGLLQGEPMKEIAQRLTNVVGMDENAAIRNARTATTAAQNAGRVDSYKDAEKLGIDMEQMWVAALDNRTRDSHRLLDGETVKVGEEFSNGCRYPGDPKCKDAGEIYNCRCTLVAVVGSSRGYEDAERNDKLGGMSYEEWKSGHDETKKYQYYADQAQKKLGEIDLKVYSGIWKNPVGLSDYTDKKGSIQGKKDYYESEIQKMKNLGYDDKAKYLEGKLAELKEFEKNGKLYEKYSLQLANSQQKLKGLKGAENPFTADAYNTQRTSKALEFSDRRKADKLLRPDLDAVWGNLEDREKYGVWEYTRNSNPINQALSGYNDGWDRSSFVGYDRANWDLQNSWRSLPDNMEKFGKNGHVVYSDAIKDLTLGIEKTELQHDIWLVRGSDMNGLCGLLEGDNMSYLEAKELFVAGDIDDIRSMLVGQKFQSQAFLSTGIASDAGFHKNISYRIYAPKGTKAVYAEPQSYFGDTSSSELYKAGKSYRYVGDEAEVIVQRGTYYRITDIEKHGYNTYEVVMEVVDQPDYFKTGLEYTFNNGKTSYKGR